MISRKILELRNPCKKMPDNNYFRRKGEERRRSYYEQSGNHDPAEDKSLQERILADIECGKLLYSLDEEIRARSKEIYGLEGILIKGHPEEVYRHMLGSNLSF